MWRRLIDNVAFLVLLMVVMGPSSASAAALNVYGDPLEVCSTTGMALAGFTRTGSCEDYDADAGSHNVCIDIPSTTQNFCDVTGQSNWCDEDKPCVEDQGENCPVEHWCVCEWAFASYLEKVTSCDEIAEIICAGTNQKAVLHYQKAVEEHGDKKSEAALECLKTRCGDDIIRL